MPAYGIGKIMCPHIIGAKEQTEQSILRYFHCIHAIGFELLKTKIDKINRRVKDYLVKAGFKSGQMFRRRVITFNITKCINCVPVKACVLSILELLKQEKMLFNS